MGNLCLRGKCALCLWLMNCAPFRLYSSNTLCSFFSLIQFTVCISLIFGTVHDWSLAYEFILRPVKINIRSNNIGK